MSMLLCFAGSSSMDLVAMVRAVTICTSFLQDLRFRFSVGTSRKVAAGLVTVAGKEPAGLFWTPYVIRKVDYELHVLQVSPRSSSRWRFFREQQTRFSTCGVPLCAGGPFSGWPPRIWALSSPTSRSPRPESEGFRASGHKYGCAAAELWMLDYRYCRGGRVWGCGRWTSPARYYCLFMLFFETTRHIFLLWIECCCPLQVQWDHCNTSVLQTPVLRITTAHQPLCLAQHLLKSKK